MISKLLEVRDRATFIPVLATAAQPDPYSIEQAYLLMRCGYHWGDRNNSVLLTKLNGGSITHNDANYWSNRTMKTAHQYIKEHWDDLKDGDVVDVEYILGESTSPKLSEREG